MPPLDPPPPGDRDFDFEFGDWEVSHRRLKARLADSTEWEVFSGTASVRPIFGGKGNIEESWIDFPEGGYHAIAMRSYDEANRTWSIWWLDSRFPHQLDPPVIGQFDQDIGTFLARDSLRGQPILVRFRWIKSGPDEARWEQAFSPDDGGHWETNWIMDFRRKAG